MLDPGFQLGAGQIRPTVIQTAFRGGEVIRRDEIRFRRDFHRRRAFHGFRDRLEADPAAAVSGQGITPEAKLQVLGDVGGVDGWHEEAHERHIGLMGHGRRHAPVVVTRHYQHTAMRRRTIGGAVFQGIAGPIDARALAIPEAENPIHLPVFIGLHLLGPQHDRRGEILVDGGNKIDPVLVQQALGLPERLVDGTEGGSPVATDHACGVQSLFSIQGGLHQGNSNQGLRAGQENPAGFPQVTVFEFVIVELGGIGGHGALLFVRFMTKILEGSPQKVLAYWVRVLRVCERFFDK